ncbi:tetratricopeptide repeat protein [Flavihumibacter sp. ZG627]|uniref:tetratricopeptide repeat protein n=1 Tax=Flavihumibacter sp. ZG627 TaxID=1463156 RepID=UPI00057E83BE|nr:tetratricopeptide repeat protein [Flavihumibacter sp. ZG627]KIC91842.1 hypothetical protein HY58_06405 [Flavihumibacter sp. ZG627]
MKTLYLTVLCCWTLGVVNGQTDSLDYHIKKGEDAFSQLRFLPAYEHYRAAVALDSLDATALDGLANSSYELRKYDVARTAYSKIHSLQPNDTNAISKLMELHYNTRHWKDAIEMATKARKLGVGKDHDLIIAKSWYEQEHYGNALKAIEKAWVNNKTNAELPYMAGRSYIEMSNYRRAAGCYEQALALEPKNARWMYEAGMSYAAIPDDVRAVQWFEAAASNGYTRSNDFLENLANSYVGIKAFDKAIELYDELKERKPGDIELLYSIGDAYYKAGAYHDAINNWDQVLAHDKTQARAVYMIGVAYIKKGDDAKGKDLCEKAIKMDPSLAKYREKRSMFGL